MKKSLILAATCLVASLAQAAPIQPEQLQLLVKVQPFQDLGTNANTMYNPRMIDGNVYAAQINACCFGRYPWGSSILSAGTLEPVRTTRMVAPFRGADSSTYLLASGGLLTSLTRYDWNLTNPQDALFPDSQQTESFDWVDNDTIISTDYTSGNRKRLYLVDVAANPFALTKNITWNANGYITSAITTRIRNVRVGEGAGYSNYAYYGDNGVSVNPKVYALNLTTGVETLLGNWNGTLKAGVAGGAETDSWGLWTVVERGGYLYLQSSDDGIQVYSMTDPTTMGALYTFYSAEVLQATTGDTKKALYGFDVAPNGEGLLLAAISGTVYEVQRRVPVASGQWQLRTRVQPYVDLGKTAGSMYNPRFCDSYIYANEIGDTAHACFGRYAADSGAYLAGVIPATEHRMVTSFRGAYSQSYMLASGGAFSTNFTRYDFDGNNPQAVDFIDGQPVESFDWVDDDTIICTDYKSGNRKRLYLVDVTADPFALTRNTTWNVNGYITSAITTRIRNVRVGEGAGYSNYAYYGDNAVSVNPKVYALNLTTGVETLLGNWNGTLKAGVAGGAETDSWGLWTVVERGGYLYLQSSDDGIQVYSMTDPTTMGPLYTFYSPEELNGVTHDDKKVLYGFDVAPLGQELLLGSYTGNAYELEPALRLSISRSGTNVVLSWPAFHTGMVVDSSPALETAFTELTPQPAVVVVGSLNTVTIPIDPAVPAFFRLRK